MSSSISPPLSLIVAWDGVTTYGFILATLLCCLYWLHQWALPKPFPGIPYNKKATERVLGELPDLLRFIKDGDNTFVDFVQKQVEAFRSPMIQLFFEPLGKPLIVLSDFQEFQDILMRRKEFDRTGFTKNIFGGLAPNHHIIKKTDDSWRANRKLLQDLMSPSFLHQVAGPNMYTSVENLIKLWNVKAGIAGNRPFSAADDIHMAALDAVFRFSFGKDFKYNATAPDLQLIQALDERAIARLRQQDGGIDDDQAMAFPSATKDAAVSAVIDAGLSIEEINGQPFPQLRWKTMTLIKARYRRALKMKEEMVRHELEKAVARMEKDDTAVRSAVDYMVQRECKLAEKDGRAPNYLGGVMKDETFGFVIAGHETTSTTVTWGLKMLAANPRSQAELRRALQAAHADAMREKRNPAIDEITETKVPYLDAMMEEILRHAGTVPAIDREATSDTEILGHFIPKGTTVLMVSKGPSVITPAVDIDESKRTETSRLAKAEGRVRAWENNDIGAFRPERWLVPTGSGAEAEYEFDHMAGPQIAFSWGLRGCYGKRLAYLELRMLLTMILWNFELLPCPDGLSGHGAVAGITYKPSKCFVRLRKVS